MVVMAPERNRTDERLDDLAKRMDDGFRELRAELKAEAGALRTELKAETGALRPELKAETRALRAELKGETGTLRAETGALRTVVVEVQKENGEVREGLGEVKAEIRGINRTMQVGFGLIGAVLTGILGLIAAQL